MKITHKYHVPIAGDNKEEIAGILYDLVMRYGDKLLELNVEGSEIELKTLECIRSRIK